MTSSTDDLAQRPHRRVARRVESMNVRRAHLREWLRTGLWFIPGLFVLGAIVLAIATLTFDHEVHDNARWFAFGGGATSAELILATIATSMMTFTGLVFTITIVALQLASSQFSPRVLRSFLRDRGSQIPLGTFAATFVYALIILREVRTGIVGEAFVPGLSITVSFTLVLMSLLAFVYYVNHIAQSIRAVNIIEAVAHETRGAIEDNYPTGTTDEPPRRIEWATPDQRIALARSGGDITGVEIQPLVRVATRHDCVIRMLPAVGDFVARGAPIFEIHGASGIPPHELLVHVDVERERTMFQDPAFGFRQLVDIAERALSPAVNDPTTAVQVIDRLYDLLWQLRARPDPAGEHVDDAGELRLVRPVLGWETFVTLAFEEIRQYGATSVQVHRRLRASALSLLDGAPPERRAPLERQLRLLDRSASRHFPDPEEHELAVGYDDAGLGGRLHR